MKDHENVIERAAEVALAMYAQHHTRELVRPTAVAHVRTLNAAGLLVTPPHEEALKACEEYAASFNHHRKVFASLHLDAPALEVYEVGQRSLAAKAAAQESPLARVKELEKWLKHIAKLPCIQSYLKESRPCARYECAPCIAMRAMSTLSKSASFGEDE